jgi:hypothetical protein
MSYCPTCGRQRTGNARYCGGCGRDFGVAAMAGSAAPAAETGAQPQRVSPSAEAPPPTVTVTSAGQPATPAPGPPQPAPPVFLPPGERQGRGRMVWALAAVIVLLAAGGGTFALVRNADERHTAGPGGGAPAVTTRASPPPSQPASPQPSPSPSPSPSLTPSASPSPSVVSIGPAVNASPQVEVVLSHYFQGINDRNYAEYASAETAKDREDQPKSSFDAGYATTTDTGMTLKSLTPTGDGDLTATVVFTSRQSPSDSVDDSACNNWTLNLYLVRNGAGYLIAPAPPDYQPAHTDC